MEATPTAIGSESITRDELDAWVLAMRKRGLSPSAANVYIRAVKSFLSWLREREHDVKAIKLLKVDATVTEAYAEVDFRKLITFHPTTFTQKRIWTLTCLLLDTGLRISEALNAKSEDFDLDSYLVVVTGKRKQRRVPFPLNCGKSSTDTSSSGNAWKSAGHTSSPTRTAQGSRIAMPSETSRF